MQFSSWYTQVARCQYTMTILELHSNNYWCYSSVHSIIFKIQSVGNQLVNWLILSLFLSSTFSELPLPTRHHPGNPCYNAVICIHPVDSKCIEHFKTNRTVIGSLQFIPEHPGCSLYCSPLS